MQLLLLLVAEEHICRTMSVLNPLLQPTEVKEYLCKGDRFIKWDDVSTGVFLPSAVSVVAERHWLGHSLWGGWEPVFRVVSHLTAEISVQGEGTGKNRKAED